MPLCSDFERLKSFGQAARQYGCRGYIRVGTDEDGNPALGIEFVHRSDVTEDHIQAALLSELERSRPDGCISDIWHA